MAQDIGQIIFQQLLGSAKKAKQAAESDIGQELLKKMILGTVAPGMNIAEDVARSARATGAMSTAEPGNAQSTKQAATSAAKETVNPMASGIDETVLSPVMQAVKESTLKTIKKMTESNIAEAAEAQGPIETAQAADELIRQIDQGAQTSQAPAGTVSTQPGLSMAPGMDPLSASFAGAPQSNQPSTPLPGQSNQSGQVINPEGLMQMLLQRRGMTSEGNFQTGGILPNFFDAGAQALGRPGIIDQSLKQQELLGQKPLQKGDKEKFGLEAIANLQQTLAKQGLEGLSPEDAQKFSLLVEGKGAVDQIDNLIFQDDSLFGTGGTIVGSKLPGFLKSQRGRQLQSAVEQAIQARTRIETGAAMQKDELKKTAKRFMPKPNDDSQTIRKKLATLSNFFTNAISLADPQGIHSSRLTGGSATQSGQTLPGTIQVTGIREIK